MTIKQALQRAAKKLSLVSSDSGQDAERLLLFVLNQDESTYLYSHGDQVLSDLESESFLELVEGRASGVPLAYLLGAWDFYGRTFFVNKNVLVPRPETEGLVEAALREITRIGNTFGTGELVVADVGTGSGCVAITLALETLLRPYSVRLIATDISPEALKVAKRNAEFHGVSDRIEFREGDLLAPIEGERLDLIVSNPPYVPSAELEQAEYSPDTIGLTHEPKHALDGGPDGLMYVDRLKAAHAPVVVESVGGTIEVVRNTKQPAV